MAHTRAGRSQRNVRNLMAASSVCPNHTARDRLRRSLDACNQRAGRACNKSRDALAARTARPVVSPRRAADNGPEKLETVARWAGRTAGVIVETHQLTKTYGSLAALAECSLRIDAGEVFGFLGPNGAGKTTLLRLLLG